MSQLTTDVREKLDRLGWSLDRLARHLCVTKHAVWRWTTDNAKYHQEPRGLYAQALEAWVAEEE